MEKVMQYAVICALTLALILVPACDMCDYANGTKIESVSHEYIATTEGADCGAVSGYETSVEIERPYYIRGTKAWTSKGLLFRGRAGLGQITLKWADDHHLSVSCRCKTENVIFSANQWRDVNVIYEFTP